MKQTNGMREIALLLLGTFLSLAACAQQDSVYLYAGAVPGSLPKNIPEKVVVNPQDGVWLVLDIQKPLFYVHLPAKPNGASVVICPGGGYYALAMDHEGHALARWFNQRGITAFVLKSRLPKDELMTKKSMRPLQDAQQAFRIIRKNASRWKIDPNKIGIMGFSAGGHLAATAGTHFTSQVGEITDLSVSVRPDFMILVYPDLESYKKNYSPAFTTTRDNLLGKNPSDSLKDAHTNVLHITKQTPPTFLIMSADDFIHPQGSIEFFLALKKNEVPAEMHVYEKGGHGYSLTQKGRGHVEQWATEMDGWLRDHGMVNP